MRKQKTKVGTLTEFIAALKDSAPGTGPFWYRGQSSSFGGGLRPLLYRKSCYNNDDALYDEDLLRSEFMRLGRQVAGGEPRDYWEWYFLMQHLGVPTRILDWTDNALAALHFAVSSDAPGVPQKPDNEGPVVYALDPHWLNTETFRRSFRKGPKPSGVMSPDWEAAQRWLVKDLFRRPIAVKYPVAINPPHISPRLAAQGSRFVLFGRDFDGLTRLARLAKTRGLSCIEIDADNVSDLRTELRSCGVSDFTLFPDLGGLGKQLLNDWTLGTLA